jgi:hypothetical protein
MKTVTKAIIMFSGFQESEARRSGFEAGFFSVIRPFANGEVTVYHPRTWKTNVKNLLRQLYENGISNVAIVSYSHGQSATIDFAKLAPQYGVSVDVWLACDPVYRPSWAPRTTWGQVFAIRAFIGSPTIKAPQSIKVVHYVLQDISQPQGHYIKAEDPRVTKVHPPRMILLPHTRIDESPEWWEMVRQKLTEFTA